MKKRTLILFFLTLCFINTLKAQDIKYVIDGNVVTAEVLNTVPGDSIASMNKKVDDGFITIEIFTKAYTQNATSSSNITATPPKTSTDENPSSTNKPIEIGDALPDITFTNFNGKKLTPDDLKGKVVLVNLWATWCVPCLMEFAEKEFPTKILNKYAENKNFVFLAVGKGESKESLDKFFNTTGGKKYYTFLKENAVIDPDGSIYNQFANSGIPRSYIINPDGIIIFTTLGAKPTNTDQLAEKIDELLK